MNPEVDLPVGEYSPESNNLSVVENSVAYNRRHILAAVVTGFSIVAAHVGGIARESINSREVIRAQSTRIALAESALASYPTPVPPEYYLGLQAADRSTISADSVEYEKTRIKELVLQELGLQRLVEIKSESGISFVVYGDPELHNVDPMLLEEMLVYRYELARKTAGDDYPELMDAYESFWEAYNEGKLQNVTVHIVIGPKGQYCTPEKDNGLGFEFANREDSPKCVIGLTYSQMDLSVPYGVDNQEPIALPPQFILAIGLYEDSLSDESNTTLAHEFEHVVFALGSAMRGYPRPTVKREHELMIKVDDAQAADYAAGKGVYTITTSIK